MTTFQESILKIVRLIPPGRVASYGQVAAYIGLPRGAREVGWAMSSMNGTPDFPWWRVLNNQGRITIRGNQFSNAEQQQALLQAEGIDVDNFELNIERYRFRPDAALLASFKLDPQYVQYLFDKYGSDWQSMNGPGQPSLF